MPEPTTETGTQATATATSGTASASTQTTETQTSTPESNYDRIIREYFSEVTGETDKSTQSTSTQTQQDSNEGVRQAFSALNNDLQAIKTQLAGMGTKPEQVSQETKDEFLDLYARGDKQGAREALIREMAPQIKSELARSVSQDVIQATRAETEIRDYGTKLRTDNPDLVPFERAISLEANDLVKQAVKEGLVKTIPEYVSASKRALKVTVDAYKKRTQAIKGEGVTQAQTRQTQVVSSSAVTPSQTHQQSSDTTSQEPDVSAASYLARRRERNLAGRGIGVT